MDTPNTTSSPKTTMVLGYYNPNPYPVSVGYGFVLHERGDYITDALGRKVNDPFFDRFVTKNGLAKEVGTDPVPFVYLQAPVGPAATHGYDGTSNFTIDRDTHVPTAVPENRPPVVIPNANQSPVRGMSMAEAKRLRIIKDVRGLPDDFGVEERADRDVASEAGYLPEHYDLPPKRITDNQGAGPKLTPKKVLPPLPAPVVPEAEKWKPELHDIPQARFAENQAKPVPKKDLPPLAPNPDDRYAVGQQKKSAPVLEQVVPVTPTTISASDLPEPELPPSDPKADYKFVAPNGKKFKFRSKLEAYMVKEYPVLSEQYMAQYPKES